MCRPVARSLQPGTKENGEIQRRNLETLEKFWTYLIHGYTEDEWANLSSDSDVGEGDAATRGVPLGDVEQPLGGRARLKEVAEQASNLMKESDARLLRTIVMRMTLVVVIMNVKW